MAILKHFDFEIPAWGEFSQAPQVFVPPAPTTYRDLVRATLPTSLASYVRLNDTSTTTATDLVGSDGFYAPSSGGVWTGGQHGQPPLITNSPDAASARLIAVNRGYVRTAHTPSNTGDLTIMFWFRDLGQTTGGSFLRPLLVIPGAGSTLQNRGQINIFAARGNHSAPGLLRFLLGSNVEVEISTSVGVDITDGLPHMLAVVKDGTTARVYYDGALVLLTTFGPLDFVGPADIGGMPTEDSFGSRYFNGQFAEFAAWFAALSGGQISNIYQQGTQI